MCGTALPADSFSNGRARSWPPRKPPGVVIAGAGARASRAQSPIVVDLTSPDVVTTMPDGQWRPHDGAPVFPGVASGLPAGAEPSEGSGDFSDASAYFRPEPADLSGGSIPCGRNAPAAPPCTDERSPNGPTLLPNGATALSHGQPPASTLCSNWTSSPPNGTSSRPNGTSVYSTGTALHSAGVNTHTTGTGIHPIGTSTASTGTNPPSAGTNAPSTGTQMHSNRTHVPANEPHRHINGSSWPRSESGWSHNGPSWPRPEPDSAQSGSTLHINAPSLAHSGSNWFENEPSSTSATNWSCNDPSSASNGEWFRSQPSSGPSGPNQLLNGSKRAAITERGTVSRTLEAIHMFLRMPCFVHASLLLQLLVACSDLGEFEASLVDIVETAASLITSCDLDSSVTGLALILLVQSKRYALDYLEMSSASFTAVCLLHNETLVQHRCFPLIAQSMAQIVTEQSPAFENLANDLSICAKSMIFTTADTSDRAAMKSGSPEQSKPPSRGSDRDAQASSDECASQDVNLNDDQNVSEWDDNSLDQASLDLNVSDDDALVSDKSDDEPNDDWEGKEADTDAELDDSDDNEVDSTAWSQCPSSFTDKVIAEFIAAVCVSSVGDSVLAEVLLSWWSLRSSTPAVVQRIVFTLLNIVARGKTPNEVISTAKYFGNCVLDGFEVHKMLPKNELLRFCGCLGQAVQSPEWPAGEVFLTHFIKLIVDRMHSKPFTATDDIHPPGENVSVGDDDFTGMGFAMFYEWQDLLRKLTVSLNHQPLSTPESDTFVRDKMLILLSENDEALTNTRHLKCASQKEYVKLVLGEQLVNSKMASASEVCPTIRPVEWFNILKQCDISQYYGYMRDLAYETARLPTTNESCLTGLYGFMRRFVMDDPASFDMMWLKRTCWIRNEEPLVSFVVLASIYLQNTHDLKSLELLLVRLKEPGFKLVKIRILKMLRKFLCFAPMTTSASGTSSYISMCLAWIYVFIAVADPEKMVQRDALKTCFACLHMRENRETIQTLLMTGSSDESLPGLQLFAKELKHREDSTSRDMRLILRDVVEYWLTSGNPGAASVVVEANGSLMPLKWLQNSSELSYPTLAVYLQLTHHALDDQTNNTYPQNIIDRLFKLTVFLLNKADVGMCQLSGDILAQLSKYQASGKARRHAVLVRLITRRIVSLKGAVAGLMTSEMDDRDVADHHRSVLIIGYSGRWNMETSILKESLAVLSPLPNVDCKFAHDHQSLVQTAVLGILGISVFYFQSSYDLVDSNIVEESGLHQHLPHMGAKVLWSLYSRLHNETAEENFLEILRGEVPRFIRNAAGDDDLAAIHLITQSIFLGTIGPDHLISSIVGWSFSTNEQKSALALAAYNVLCDKYMPLMLRRFIPSVMATHRGPRTSNILCAMWARLRKNGGSERLTEAVTASIFHFEGEWDPVKLSRWLERLSTIRFTHKESERLVRKLESNLMGFSVTENSETRDFITYVLIVLFEKWVRSCDAEPFAEVTALIPKLEQTPGQSFERICTELVKSTYTPQLLESLMM